MIKRLLVLFMFLICTSIWAQAKSGHHDHHGDKKALGAHEHGAIKLEMAVTGKTIEIDLDGPAEAFIGFEYAPTTEKEKKAFNDAESLWKKDLLNKLFVLDPKLGCALSDVSFKQIIEDKKKHSGIHSEIEAKASINCTQDLAGNNISISVKKHFFGIKRLSIDFIGSETKSIESKATEVIKL